MTATQTANDRIRESMAANILRRVVRKAQANGIGINELCIRSRVARDDLDAHLNAIRMLPTKDAIRLCMISGVTVADISS